MANPYRGRPDYTFWKQGVADHAESGVDPVANAPFRIRRGDAVATAGSCFAQHISHTLQREGFRYLVTETFTPFPGIRDENYGVFPVRSGNIYTARQLLQLFNRAYGRVTPKSDFWTGRDGSVIDPFRPRIQVEGFGSVDNLHEDRSRHFTAIRQMFESCDIFIFTLGLTEAWVSRLDGSVFPLAPGVVSDEVPDADYTFYNFGVSEVVSDMVAFLDQFHAVNASARVVLTVSPVPLIATYEDRHVLVSTIASKSILRAAVEEIIRQRPQIAYFPSYEIVTGPQTAGKFYAPDLREVTTAGVSYVMSLFKRHYLVADETLGVTGSEVLDPEDEQRMADLAEIVCDEKGILS